jgi:hypothetical protein
LKGIRGRIGQWLRSRAREPEESPFFEIRFRWWQPFDLDGFIRDHGEKYEIEIRPLYVEKWSIDVFGDVRREFLVRADTLNTFLTAYRAILFQRETAPFTPVDRELLDYVLENYPRVRDTPLF